MEFKENAITPEIYHELRSSVEWMNFNVEQTAQGLSRSLYSLVVFDEQKPVGMGRVVGDGIYNIICDVVVDPAYQGKGIGSQIMNRLLNYLKEQTPENGRTSIHLIAEKGKETFYEKFGFKLVPNESSGSGMRMIIRK
ncbi:MAG: GNAT family N-acetyltransferase [Erysipelotrichaceae bacterium]|nr:GNAT family N-acetyltransferase [Erysipelotrichaceae bacterium]